MPDQTKVSIKGDDSTKPGSSALAKNNKEATLAEVKSKIESQATPGANVTTAIQPCPILNSTNQKTPDKKQPSSEEKVACNLSGLTVSKVGGVYTMIVAAIPNKTSIGILEVVSGYNKRASHIKSSINGPVGPCQKIHKTKVIDFTDKYTLKTDTNLEFDVASVYAFNFFPWKPTTHLYTFSASTCGASAGAAIKVYPDTYWHLKVTTTFKGKELDEFKIEGEYKEDQNNLTFSASTKKEVVIDFQNDAKHEAIEASEDGVKAGYKDQDLTVGFSASDEHVESYYDNKGTKTTSHFSADKNALDSDESVQGAKIKDLSLQSGDTKIQLNERLKSNINSLYEAISIINFIKGLIDKLSESGASPVSFDLDWPNIEVEGTWQWKEITGTPKCGFEYNVSGGLHPLIGCGIDIDLVGAVLLAIPGFGEVIDKILNVIKYITGDELQVNLKLNGDLNVDFGINKPASAAEPTINMPNVHADIILELSATLKLKKHYAFIGYGGGGKGSAKIVITLHKPVVQNHGIDLPCDYQFTGITISTVQYVKESSSWLDMLPDDEDEIVEKDEEKGHWLEGETHAFSISLI